MGSADLTVFAAASLTEAFRDIGAAFTAEYPDIGVTFNFAGSSALAAQIVEGAPADAFASADLVNMAKVTGTDVDGVVDPVVFATNRSEIIVAPGNPLGITDVSDLAEPDLVVVTCAPEVPCGTYASAVFERAAVDVTPDSYEENVKSVVTKVVLGEADAGIVYATDVAAAGADADGVEIPPDINEVAEYPIAITAEAPNPDAARSFVEFVTSSVAREILHGLGFSSP